MDKTLVKAAVAATQRVFQEMVNWEMKVNGISVESGPVEKKAELNAIISFSGQMSGTFILHCTEPLAAIIASEILGMPCDVGSADTKDAVGELLNMIVGSVKNHYQSQRDPFSISVPTIVAGTDFTVHVKSNDSDEVVSLGFEHVGGGEHVDLRMVFVSE